MENLLSRSYPSILFTWFRLYPTNLVLFTWCVNDPEFIYPNSLMSCSPGMWMIQIIKSIFVLLTQHVYDLDTLCQTELIITWVIFDFLEQSTFSCFVVEKVKSYCCTIIVVIYVKANILPIIKNLKQTMPSLDHFDDSYTETIWTMNCQQWRYIHPCWEIWT